jgi:UDP-glucose 4-epimerase
VKKYLVVGGGGFLGRHVARALARRDDAVSVVDASAGPSAGDSVESHVLDVAGLTSAGFDALVRNVDVVHHCAWSTIPESANLDPRADLQVNLGMTLGLLDALKRRGGGRMVFCSSGGTVYGPLRTTPVAEDHPLEPINAYGVSKMAAEKYMQLYRTLYGIDARVARIANPYGAGQNPHKPQGVLGTIVHRALARQAIEIWGDGTQVRDFVHIADVVAALIALADAETVDLPSDTMAVFNFGSGVGSSLNEIVAHVAACDLPEMDIRRLAGRAFDVKASVLDIRRAERWLGWHPKISLKKGIAQMISDLQIDRHRAFSSW